MAEMPVERVVGPADDHNGRAVIGAQVLPARPGGTLDLLLQAQTHSPGMLQRRRHILDPTGRKRRQALRQASGILLVGEPQIHDRRQDSSRRLFTRLRPDQGGQDLQVGTKPGLGQPGDGLVGDQVRHEDRVFGILLQAPGDVSQGGLDRQAEFGGRHLAAALDDRRVRRRPRDELHADPVEEL